MTTNVHSPEGRRQLRACLADTGSDGTFDSAVCSVGELSKSVRLAGAAGADGHWVVDELSDIIRRLQVLQERVRESLEATHA